MKTYVWLTFAFMGWGYYEMSGGSDFVPEVREVAQAETQAPEIVTRGPTTTLLTVSTSNLEPRPSDADITQALLDAVALDTTEVVPQAADPEPEVVHIVAPVPTPEIRLDIREVAGSRVNMRQGPSTGFDVVATFNGGTKLEVLEINLDGWANVTTIDGGFEGWMAERLLTDPET